MRKRILRALLTAISLMVLGTIVMVAASGDVRSATYRGSQLCVACHRGKNRAIVEAHPKTSHTLAFWRVGEEKEGQRILGDFSKDPGFTRAQVAYVLGVGRHEQAYLDKDFQLLPLFWEVSSKTWVKRMPPVEGLTQCITCHTTGFDQANKRWTEPGVGCESCHGPGSEHTASSDKNGTIVRPQTLPPLRQAMICGQCHSVGRAKSNGAPRSPEYRPGDDLTSTFTDVKPTAHVPHELPPWTEYSEWVQSKHANTPSPVTCSRCHDPHGMSNLPHHLRKAGNSLCTECHTALTGSHHSPGNLEKNTCMICHMPQGSHFFRKPTT